MTQVFQKVTESLKAEVGLKCTKQQVANKWKSFKRSYKDVKDHNNKSGNDKKTINPVTTASSSSSNVCEETGKEKREMKRKHQLDEKINWRRIHIKN